jgi:hypothetical protein
MSFFSSLLSTLAVPFLLLILFANTCRLQTTCPSNTTNSFFFSQTLPFLCSSLRPKNAPNCYIGPYPSPDEAVTEDTIVAFISDSGLNSNSRAVLQLIKDNEASVVMHAGDLDYQDSPESWEYQIDSILGEGFPFFSAFGNHEFDAFDGPNGYQRSWFDRLTLLGSKCIGTVGLGQVCSFSGITFFIAAPWQGRYNDTSPFISQEELSNSIEEAFVQFGSRWRICIWHFNYDEYQLGDKSTEAEIFLYDTCRRVGAFIQNGHEHSYARTHLMSSYENFTIASTSDNITLDLGETFLFISAVGGHSIRPCQGGSENNPWWASALCRNSEPPLDYGALFCKFNPNGTGEDKASCWFEQIDGTIRDQFTITTLVEPSSCCQVEEGVSCRENLTLFEPSVCDLSIDLNCGAEELVDCTCSGGEECETTGSSGVCQCVQENCENLGRVCAQNGCVFPFNNNVVPKGHIVDTEVSVPFIVVTSTLIGVIMILILIWLWQLQFSSGYEEVSRIPRRWRRRRTWE